MQSRHIAAATLLIGGVASCSSQSPAQPTLPEGALAAGTAQVIIDAAGSKTTGDVRCQTIQYLTSVVIGQTDGEVTLLVDNAAAPTAKAVTFNNVGGFTGSYWPQLQGSAQITMVDQTYSITGTADGFAAQHPSTRTAETFTVKVAC
jgi:hypothetical protein